MIFLPKINNIFLKNIIKNIIILVKNIVIFLKKILIFLANIKNIDIIITISKYYY